ncbi:hypothetical protein D3C86_1522630 [compost metagenome]
MNTCGCFSNTFAKAANSSLLYTVPVGLFGEENMNNFVFGVIAASSCSGVILKLLSISVLMKTDFPSAKTTISE